MTQIALGAALGHAALGRTVGRTALAWGGMLGTLPDLDVLWPYADPVAAFTWHRGYSHSLICLTLAAPLLAAALHRLHRAAGATFGQWLWLCWLVLFTHPLLDACTIYGTQLLLPLSDHPFGTGSVFIIDPAYTLPLLGAVGAAALRGTRAGLARRLTLAALAFSTAYLGAGLALQRMVQADVETALAARDLAGRRVLVQAAPFTVLLWRVVVVDGETWHEGFRSVFDRGPHLDLVARPRAAALLAPLADSPAVSRLAWFSKGWWRAQERDGAIVMSDLRMGVGERLFFAFAVGARHDGGSRALPVRQLPPERAPLSDLPRLLARIVDEQAFARPGAGPAS